MRKQTQYEQWWNRHSTNNDETDTVQTNYDETDTVQTNKKRIPRTRCWERPLRFCVWLTALLSTLWMHHVAMATSLSTNIARCYGDITVHAMNTSRHHGDISAHEHSTLLWWHLCSRYEYITSPCRRICPGCEIMHHVPMPTSVYAMNTPRSNADVS